MEGGIDSLLEVTAHFYKAGTKIYDELEDTAALTSYGQIFDDVCTEYWDLIEEDNIVDDPNFGMLVCNEESKFHYLIKKDFIGFEWRLVSWGDFGDSHMSGCHFEEEENGLIDVLLDFVEEFSQYANEEKRKYDDKRQGKNVKIPSQSVSGLVFEVQSQPKTIPETDCVKFIVALDYQTSDGGYYGDDYDSWVDLIGKVDMSRIKEIIGK